MTAMVQIIGRASRNPKGEVVLYADNFTESMIKALRETYRRCHIQEKYNKNTQITMEINNGYIEEFKKELSNLTQ